MNAQTLKHVHTKFEKAMFDSLRDTAADGGREAERDGRTRDGPRSSSHSCSQLRLGTQKCLYVIFTWHLKYFSHFLLENVSVPVEYIQ